MFGIKKHKREKIRARPFPEQWLAIIKKNVAFYHRLPEGDQKELLEHILVFLEEKNFEGCGGLQMTDEIKVTIAAQACILLLHREVRYYPELYSILVYPTAFIAKGRQELAPGYFVETDQIHLGESWKHGALVLAWDMVKAGAADIHDGHNVVFHEFAHQLDTEDGRADGAPLLERRSMYIAWARILGREYQKLRDEVGRHHATVLDQYGATDPAEFFAVATECFFEKSTEMKRRHPELYEELKLYYKQDPAELKP